MKKIFLKWIFLLVSTAFILTFAASYYIQTTQSKKVGLDLIELKITDVKHQLNLHQQNLNAIIQLNNSNILVKAKMFAKLVYYNPKIITNEAELERTKDFLNVDEVHISDSKGLLIASYPKKYKAFNMASTTQSRAFMPALTNPKFELVQKPMMRGENDGIFQYAGVARIGKPGIIQIGFEPKKLEEAKRFADIKNISYGFRIGEAGSIIIIQNDDIISTGIGDIRLLDPIEKDIIKASKQLHKPFKIRVKGIRYTCLSDTWQNYTIVGILPESEMYLSRNSVVKSLLAVNFILFTIIFILIITLLQKVVISGIYKVNNSLDKITNGDLEEKVNVKNSEEFEMLSDGINTTVDALKQAIDAESQRLNEELELAKSIQHSALPNVFPPYPTSKEFDIFASMDTAKEVGGDFYDFFFINPDNFAFLVADVSGKGIPAALFMMTTKTLIKNYAKTGMPIERVITKTNKQIYKNNENGFFVTLFMCVLELSTGKLTYVNAGHNPPLIKKNNAEVKYLETSPNLVLGAMTDYEFNSETITISPKDVIVLYTDGITEALNTNQEFYGEDRLLNKIRETNTTLDIEKISKDIRQDVRNFVQGELQSDDITLLVYRYNGFDKTIEDKDFEKISIPAKVKKYKKILPWLENQYELHNVSDEVKDKITLAIEETFTNIASYAYPDEIGSVIICIKFADIITIKFIDYGMQYNPLEKPDPDITLSAEERPIGGLGIFMTKQCMDECSYEYKDEKNILTLKVKA